jgi:hypothetical protein
MLIRTQFKAYKFKVNIRDYFSAEKIIVWLARPGSFPSNILFHIRVDMDSDAANIADFLNQTIFHFFSDSMSLADGNFGIHHDMDIDKNIPPGITSLEVVNLANTEHPGSFFFD